MPEGQPKTELRKVQTEKRTILKQIVSTAIILLVVVLLSSRCAHIAMPMGGPTDTLPPRVLLMEPGFGNTNFKEKRVTLTFDEYVALKDQYKEFFTSPMMKKLPLLTIRGKSIQIDFQEPLDSNQTYALNFGNSLVDNNEGNPLAGFRYVFSTGKTIDSMLMSGYTANAQSGDSIGRVYICFFDDATADSLMRLLPSDTMTIDSLTADSLARVAQLALDSLKALDSLVLDSLAVDSLTKDSLPDYDSVLYKVRADVIARSRPNGVFIAENLAPKNYRVYAFEDNNGNRLYDAGVDRVAFLDSVYNPLNMPPFSMWFDTLRRDLQAEPQLYFRLFKEKIVNLRANLASIKRPEQQRLYMTFTGSFPQIESFVLDSVPEDSIIFEYHTQGKDTISLWLNMLPQNLPDSLYGQMIYMKYDSVGVLKPDTVKVAVGWRDPKAKEKKKEAERLEKERKKAGVAGMPFEETELGKANKPPVLSVNARISGGKVIPEDKIEMSFQKPLNWVDIQSMEMYLHSPDNDSIKTLVDLKFEQDTLDMKKWWLSTDWKSLEKYSLMIPAGALRDISGLSNDTLNATFTMDSPDKYATFLLNINSEDKNRNYIVQILNSSGSILKEIKFVKAGQLKVEYIPAGEVKIRIIEDMNGNGEWDPGDLRLRHQPEKIANFTTVDGQEIITAKLNWELEFDINTRQMFAPMTMEKLVEYLKRKDLENKKRYDEEKRKREEQRNHSH